MPSDMTRKEKARVEQQQRSRLSQKLRRHALTRNNSQLRRHESEEAEEKLLEE
jgi:hypothetical protein